MKKLIFVTILILITIAEYVSANTRYTYEYILPPEYVNVEINEEYDTIIAWTDNNQYALYNYNGTKISEDYENMVYMDNWAILAKYDGIDYILNQQGNVIHIFDNRVIGVTGCYVLVDLSDNNDGRPMRYYEGEFAICNTNGEKLAVRSYDNHIRPMSFQWGLDFENFDEAGTNGRMVFNENGKYGAIDDDFETVIEPKYDMLYKFQNGTAYAILDGKYGVIDKSGNVKIDFVYDEICPIVGGYYVLKDGLYGVASADGTLLIDTVLQEIPRKIYTDYKLIEISKPNSREDASEYSMLYGLIDYDGKVVLPVEHIGIGGIGDGCISARKAYDKGGIYDLNGNELTEFVYRAISTFSEGLAVGSAVNENGEWSNEIINTNGETVFEVEDYFNGYRNGFGVINNKKLIDRDGNVVIDFNGEDNITISPTAYWENYGDLIYKVNSGSCCGLIRLLIDEPSDWAKETVEFAKELGLLPEELQNRYRKNIKREIFCELVYELPFVKSAKVEPVLFTDTKNSKVQHLAGLGVINGVGDGLFASDSLITREEAATILNRVLVLANREDKSIGELFEDDNSISDWAKDSVYRVRNAGVMNGMGDNMFVPKGKYTTEQAIVTVLRVANMV